jgi:hypothetical protein
MKNLLEDKSNLNFDIFTIPAEEGGSEEDRYLASIGDAAQKHIQSLSPGERQLWDSLLHMDNTGAIFRIEDSPFHRDTDPFNFEKEGDLEKAFQIKIMKAFKGKDVDEEFIQILREEFEKEVERRQKSEDIADVGIPIPYHDWEKFPQMHKHWDMEPTPKPLFIFMGSSRPYFYDAIPEHHPDKQRIEQVLQLFNRDWDDITEDFVDWAWDNVIAPINFKQSKVSIYLYNMATALEEGFIKPEEAISTALAKIDADYQETYLKKGLKLRDKDPIHQILNINENIWIQQKEEGLKPYTSVKKLGQTLYKDHLDKTTGSHWGRYRGLKKRFAPAIFFKGIDLNKASVYDLKKTLKLKDSEARSLWFARPFDNIGILRSKGYLAPSRITKDPQTEKTLILIDKKLELSIENEDGQLLTNLGKALRGLEVKGLTSISKEEWQTVWFYYRMTKAEMFNVLNKIERKKKNDAKKR